MTQPDVVIVIVTYNSRDVIAACLNSTKQTNAEVLVVDNASKDGTAEFVSEMGFEVIANTINRGFAGAVNQAVRATGAPFVLLLNPDAILLAGIGNLLNQCKEPHTGAAGGKLVSPDGVPQKGFTVRRFPTPWTLFFETALVNRLWPKNPVNWRYRCLDVDLTHPAEIDQPAGAFLLFRRDAWERIGGWDEGFFPIWFEDVDFCKRLRNAGYAVWYRPEAVAEHRGGHSVARIGLGMRTDYWYRSLLRYSIKHFHAAGKLLACFGVIAGSSLRLLLGTPGHKRRDLVRIYTGVVKLAFRSIWIKEMHFGERLV